MISVIFRNKQPQNVDLEQLTLLKWIYYDNLEKTLIHILSTQCLQIDHRWSWPNGVRREWLMRLTLQRAGKKFSGYRKIRVISPRLIQLRKGVLVSKRKIFWKESVCFSLVWHHEKNCRKGGAAWLYQEGGITGIMFSYQTGGLKKGWAYQREGW